MIQLQDVSKIYNGNSVPVHALREVNLQMAEGEFVAVMGPSGSGKTTMLTLLGAMNPPTQGQVVVDEIDVYSLGLERQADFLHEYIGFIFQQLQLLPYLTSLENVLLALAIARKPKGEKAARAIVNQPPLVLADEPTGIQILDLLRHLNRRGQTVGMITHDREAASYAHRIINLLDGRIAT